MGLAYVYFQRLPGPSGQSHPPLSTPILSLGPLWAPSAISTRLTRHGPGSLSLWFSQWNQISFPFLLAWISFIHPSVSRKSSLPRLDPHMHHLRSVPLFRIPYDIGRRTHQFSSSLPHVLPTQTPPAARASPATSIEPGACSMS